MNETIYRLISRYLDGRITTEEIRDLESWTRESEENLKKFRQIKNLWGASASIQFSEEEGLKNLQKRIRKPVRLPLWKYGQRVAAILLIPLLLALLWLYSSRKSVREPMALNTSELTAPFGSVTSSILPDGSRVWLNAGSILQLTEAFTPKERKVILRGEAYFEVQSDKSHPFLVQTPDFIVRVTGTRFNVRHVQGLGNPTVTLVEGKVEVQSSGGNGKPVRTARLLPNQQLTFDLGSGRMEITKEEVHRYIAWKEGKLVFRNDPLSEVVNRLSQQFNADIRIEDEALKKKRFRATFTNESLDEILRLLALSSSIGYRETTTIVQPDSSTCKRTIILFKP